MLPCSNIDIVACGQCLLDKQLVTFGMLVDDSYDSIMGEILIPAGSDPVSPGTTICKTLNEDGAEQENEGKESDESKYHQVFEGSDWLKHS